MSLTLWLADITLVGIVALMVLSWVFEPRTARPAAAKAVTRPARRSAP